LAQAIRLGARVSEKRVETGDWTKSGESRRALRLWRKEVVFGFAEGTSSR